MAQRCKIHDSGSPRRIRGQQAGYPQANGPLHQSVWLIVWLKCRVSLMVWPKDTVSQRGARAQGCAPPLARKASHFDRRQIAARCAGEENREWRENNIDPRVPARPAGCRLRHVQRAGLGARHHTGGHRAETGRLGRNLPLARPTRRRMPRVPVQRLSCWRRVDARRSEPAPCSAMDATLAGHAYAKAALERCLRRFGQSLGLRVVDLLGGRSVGVPAYFAISVGAPGYGAGPERAQEGHQRLQLKVGGRCLRSISRPPTGCGGGWTGFVWCSTNRTDRG